MWLGAVVLAAAMPFAGGCWGLRRGVASVPYLEETPTRGSFSIPRRDLFHRRHVDMADMRIHVRLFDEVVSSDLAAVFYVIPVRIRLRDKEYFDAAAIRIDLDIHSSGVSRTFDPARVELEIGDEICRPARKEFRSVELEPGRNWSFSLVFDRPMPKSESEMRLNLAPAFSPPLPPGVPAIRFKRIRWREWYS
jgi:hypothetical protein